MNKILNCLVLAAMVTMCVSCSKSPEKDAKTVADKLKVSCDVIEAAIADEIITDEEAVKIKEAREDYNKNSYELQNNYVDDENGMREYLKALSDNCDYQRYGDLQIKMSETEGFAKIEVDFE